MESNRQDLVGAADMRGNSFMVNEKKKKNSPKWCYLGVIPKSLRLSQTFLAHCVSVPTLALMTSPPLPKVYSIYRSSSPWTWASGTVKQGKLLHLEST